jgi:hypothetical protein
MGTVLLFRDEAQERQAEIALANGERIRVVIARNGLVIKKLDGANPKSLFEANSAIVAHLCAGLISSPKTVDASPLRIIVTAVGQLQSAADIEKAFHDAAAQIF